MAENIIVGIIVLAAAAFTVYRIFVRPSCGCGSDCACSGSKKRSGKAAGDCCGSKNGASCCGK